VVLLFCENSVEAYLAKIGIAKAGLVAAPLNPMMAPDLVAAMIDLAQPKLAIVDAELWPKARDPFAAKGLRVGTTIGIGGPPVPGSVSFTEFIAGQQTGEPDVEIHADDIWEILSTSGTTALPKGVMISPGTRSGTAGSTPGTAAPTTTPGCASCSTGTRTS
jgi:acyl-coenzyme A synthetase/AMP-(fatty) acid ligase